MAANAVPLWQAPVQPEDPVAQQNADSWKLIAVIGGSVLAIGAVVALVLLIRKWIRKAAENARRRRRRINRRRSR